MDAAGLRNYLLVHLCIWAAVPVVNGQSVVRGPYLQTATDTSVIICWRTSATTDSKVWYGLSPDALEDSVDLANAVTDHTVKIDGLSAYTRYYYAIGHSAGILAGGDSLHTFITSPVAGDTIPLRFWVLGDCGTADGNAAAVRDAYYNYAGTTYTQGILMLGDNAYNSGTDAEYQAAVFEMYDSLLIQSPLWPTPGNHDYGSGADATTQTGPYYDIFVLPKNGEAGGLASGTEAYYSFDIGNVHFISLDSHDSDRSPGGDMLTWLENDLLSTLQEWIIVIWHHPPYTKGSHDSDSEGRLIDMRENVLPILETHGVDLVMTGHSHSYERSILINGHYGHSSTFDSATMVVQGGDGQIDGDGAYQKNAEIGDGTVYIVAGSSGKISGGLLNHPVMFYSANTLGSVALDVYDDQLDMHFVNSDGSVDDYLTLKHQYYMGSPPAVTLTGPGDGTYFLNPQTVSLTAEASDTDGLVTAVEFIVDGQVVGVDSAAPYIVDWQIPAEGTFLLWCSAIDDSTNVAYSSTSELLVGPVTLNARIRAGNDDAEENAAGTVNLTSSDLELTTEGTSNVQTIGMRFTDIKIPKGASVAEAFVRFTVDETAFIDPCNLTIYGEDSDHSLSFTTGSFNITSRPLTTASVDWSPGSWVAENDAGPDQTTPDLAAIVQEIIDRPGYTYGSAVGFIVEGAGKRVAESYNGESHQAPELVVILGEVPSGDTLDILIVDGNDDVEENGNDASMYMNSTDIELVNDGIRGDQVVGLRFRNLPVHKGSHVNHAYIQFTVDELDAGTNTVWITAEDKGYASPFSATTGDVSSRTATPMQIPWTIPDWGVSGESGNDQRTPELRSIVQHIVDRPDWEYGSSLVLMITGSGSKTAHSFEGQASFAPMLHLEWDSACVLSHIVHVDPEANGKATGESWQDAVTTLNEALDLAARCAGIKEIWLKAGTYKPGTGNGRETHFAVSGDTGILGGFGGTEVTADERDPVANPTILSGDIGIAGDNSDNAYHAIIISTQDTCYLDGVTIRGGNANGMNVETQKGGGLVIDGTAILKNVQFDNCNALTSGNAIYVENGGNCIMESVSIGIPPNGVPHVTGASGTVIVREGQTLIGEE